MSFSTNFELMLLDPRSVFPWLTLNEVDYEDEVTGEVYTVPRHFRTDLSSVPIAISVIPVIGPLLVMRFFGKGRGKKAKPKPKPSVMDRDRPRLRRRD
jgi:hypothetical protein